MWHWMRFRCYHDNLTPLHIIIYHHKNVSCLYNEIPANVCAMAFPWDKICYLGLIEGFNYSTNLQSHTFPHSVIVFRHVKCSKFDLSYFSDWEKYNYQFIAAVHQLKIQTICRQPLKIRTIKMGMQCIVERARNHQQHQNVSRKFI